MATKYYCDRCGTEVEVPDRLFHLTVPSGNLEYARDFEDVFAKPFELCMKCVRALQEFCNPPKVNVK